MTGSQSELEPPRFEDGKELLIAGLRGHFTFSNWSGIPAQWERLLALGRIPGQIGVVYYGLCFPTSGGMDYLCGAEVAGGTGVPDGFSRVTIPVQRYAVFPHRGHVSELRNTLEMIWRKWLPSSGRQAVQPSAGAPAFFERYGEQFDPKAGMGDVEVWVPIQN